MCKGINIELVACIAWWFKQFLQQSERERSKRRSREEPHLSLSQAPHGFGARDTTSPLSQRTKIA